MEGKDQHVIKRDGSWAVRGVGNARDTSHHRTQAEAQDAAKAIAERQGSDVVVHGRDGRIRSKDSYGNDPVQVRDTEH